MRISIICVGKIKEKFYTDACAEYVKRLSKYTKLDIIELPDEKTPDNASDTMVDAILSKEADRILDKLPGQAYVYATDSIISYGVNEKDIQDYQIGKIIRNSLV